MAYLASWTPTPRQSGGCHDLADPPSLGTPANARTDKEPLGMPTRPIQQVFRYAMLEVGGVSPGELAISVAVILWMGVVLNYPRAV